MTIRQAVVATSIGLVAGLIVGGLLVALHEPMSMAVLGHVVSPTAGWVTHLALAALMGLTYARLFSAAEGYAESAMGGVAYGMLWWLIVSLTVVPLVTGQPLRWSVAGAGTAFPAFAAALIQSAMVGLGWHAACEALGSWLAAPAAGVQAAARTRIVVVGGGFSGVTAAQRLERLFARDPSVEVSLVSGVNYMLFTPMLTEVTTSVIEPRHIAPPLRAFFRWVNVVRGEVQEIDIERRVLRLSETGVVPGSNGSAQGSNSSAPGSNDSAPGSNDSAQGSNDSAQGSNDSAPGADKPADGGGFELPFDHLVLALGSVPNFYDLPGLEEHAFTFKSLESAIGLRNHVIDMLERAHEEPDGPGRRAMLTFVVAGGGFAGTELVGALNDFVRSALAFYPNIRQEEVVVTLVHTSRRILPELSESLAGYALGKLEARGVTCKCGYRVAGAEADRVLLNNGESIDASTLVWTAGNVPHPLVRSIPGATIEHSAIKTDSTLAVVGLSHVWAVGDCARITDAKTGEPALPTAQHALVEGPAVARNVHAVIRGRAPKPFHYSSIGSMALLGHHVAAAEVKGMKFSGLLAWMMWRLVYLYRLPTLERKLRVTMDWIVDMFFPPDIVQTLSPSRVRAAALGARPTATETTEVVTTSGRDA